MQQRVSTLQDAPGDVAVRQRIVAAARQHFFTHGFRGVTMDDLAQELGMSKKTLYAHFASKNAPLEAMLQQKFNEGEAELARITSQCSGNFAIALRELLACAQRHTEEVQPPFLRDIQREAPELFQVVERRRRDVIERYFTKLLNEGRREGLIRRDVPVPIIMEILLGTIGAIMNPPKLTELGLTVKSGFNAIITVILEGALAPESRAKL
jgi:AcrR family transcriptional regulator